METTYSDEKQSAEYNPKTRWLIPNRLDFMTFVGKDVLAVAHDIYITFFNLKTNSEIVYVVNNEDKGDGVDVVAGHRSNIFVFAEKRKQPRIFVLIYPTFQELAQLKDTEVNRYKGLCMMECDLVAGFTGFPNYLVTVWNWRTQQRLLALPTGVLKRKQIYMPSQTHMLLCECWGEGLIVWDVAQCYKRCFMMKRAKEEVTGWEISDPALVGVCWTNDGHLYAIDSSANLYSVISDGIGMITNLEWSEDLQGADKPSICSFCNGILIYGPDQKLRFLKKWDSTWKVVWSFVPDDSVVRLISNATYDLAAMWTACGFLYKLVGETEEKIDVVLYTYRQRNIVKIQLIAPDFTHLATMNKSGELCFYEALSGKLVLRKLVEGNEINFQGSPVDPLLVIFGEVGQNYGIGLFTYEPGLGLQKVGSMCLTHQIISQVVFSSTGRKLVAVAKSAGHIFIFELSEKYKLTLVRYAELGRGLADSFLMKVGEAMRSFNLILFSDKYFIGERIVCINADSGKDNKFAGKMQGPYSEVVPLAARDCALAVPHLSTHMHVLRLSGEKGKTVSVKMGPVFESGHDLKQFRAFCNGNALLTFGYDGVVILRKPDAPEKYDLKLIVSHRYESGVEQALIDSNSRYIVHVGGNGTAAVTVINNKHEGVLTELSTDIRTEAPDPNLFEDSAVNIITIFNESEKNYLDVVEDKRVREETLEFARQRAEVSRGLEAIQERVVALLESNLAAPPLHRLPLSSFNLHVERTNERVKQAEEEREQIRLQMEARIRAQDTVTAWIRSQCWDSMITPRIKLFSIFSHYHVENFAVLPNQREVWPELQLTEALRTLEMENDADVFRPWEEHTPTPAVEYNQMRPDSIVTIRSVRKSTESQAAEEGANAVEDGAVEGSSEDTGEGRGACEPVLAGTRTRRLLDTPPYALLQPLAYSFLHVNMLQHLARLNTQNLRLWFNKQFDDLMNLKKREVGLVQDRNTRLRFIIEELNTLSDLRGSFHHLNIEIKDPEWRQEEQPHKLIKVEPEECSIPPYVSPSQMSVAPPAAGGPDEFRERALMYMMDGVLEKLWHEEIKKPVPMPQCMLEKDPEHFNEDDLRLVFDYEAKVAFRNEEREKYRKMLHAEYAKLSQLLNEGIVKFNLKVKDTWLLKLRVDSIISQENLILMRLRRTNLDRIEMAEHTEEIRNNIAKYEAEVEQLQKEIQLIQEQSEECQASYDALAQKDRHMDKTFKNHFADLSPIIVDQCYKFFKKRPKWQQRASMTPGVLLQLASAAAGGPRPPMLHPDCLDYLRALEQLDMISNMPPVMDEALWATMCKLRRTKVENEIRMRAMVQEMAYVESGSSVWHRAVVARRTLLARQLDDAQEHRQRTELLSRNKTIQLVLPAGQVEIVTTGHVEDFEDAALIPREDIERINELILKVGNMKLNMMRKQMEYRKGILSKEWEHAQMKMKLRHMEQELYSYQRLKIPKELQLHLKNKELGYTEEHEFMRMEKEMEATKVSVNKMLGDQVRRVEELELKCATLTAEADKLEKIISNLNMKVSEKRLNEDPLQPIRVRKIFKKRMETLVARSQLIREVQANHTRIVLLQTELELLRLKTYPTLATFRTVP